MENEIKEGILSKIAALLNKTVEYGATEFEAEAAAAKAAELMAKYGIESRMVEKEKESDKNKIGNDKTNISKNSHYRQWQLLLSGSCAKVCFCYAVHSGDTIVFFGTKEEVQATKELYNWLGMQIAFISAEIATGKGKRFGNQFSLGMTVRVGQRLISQFNETVSSYETGNAIVRQSKEENVAAAQEMFPFLRKKSIAPRTSEGFKDGLIAGESVKLKEDRKLEGSQTSKLSGGIKALVG